MSMLSPWQLILWIFAVELVSLPLLSAFVSSIFNGYFKAKERHTSVMANAISEGLQKASNMITGKGNKEDNKED